MYRIFISYSHEDLEDVERIVRVLQENGLTVLWDKEFAVGKGFQEQIRTFIAYSHVFLPVLTAQSSQRGWVHQEIGYAMALNVPVLPVAMEVLPGQMLEQLHALRVGRDEAQLKAELSLQVFDRLVSAAADPNLALFQLASEQEDRSLLVAKRAREVLALGYRGHVRHRGTYTAFDIPENSLTNALWRERYDGFHRSPYQNQLKREERLALGEHAKGAGCSLIVNLHGTFDQYGPLARPSRLRVLRSFLESMPDEKVRAAINNQMQHGENVLLVGDWFVAAPGAGAQGVGHRRTAFSRHAPTMLGHIGQFDEHLHELLATAGVDPSDSRRAVIAEIDRVLADISPGRMKERVT